MSIQQEPFRLYYNLSFQLRQRKCVHELGVFVISCQEYVTGGWGFGGLGAAVRFVTDTLQLALTALTTLTACGKRKGAEMEGSPAVEVTGQS